MEDEQVVQEVVENQVVEDAVTEAAEQEVPVKKEEKLFTQAELDDIIKKRLDREFRKRERISQTPIPKAEPQGLDPNAFEDVDKYADALADRKIAEREAAKQWETYVEKEEDARDRYEDFDAVARNNNFPVTPVMAEAIKAASIGPDILYYLGSNPNESARIANLPPVLQVKEIGKIEARLEDKPLEPKKTTTAPPPINPVKPDSGVKTFDTSDPRSLKSMSTSEWIEARNRELAGRARK